MRIAIAADTYYPNIDGASYFTQRLAAGLKKRGHKILVIAPGTSRTTEFTKDGNGDVLSLYSLPTLFHKSYRFTPPLFIQQKIKRALLAFKPHIIHIQGHFFVESAVAKVGRELGIPVIGTNHFMPENLVHYGHLPARINEWLIKMGWKMFARVFNTIGVITTPTHTAAAVLRKIGLAKPVHVISCGIDLATFHPGPADEHFRKKYRLPRKPLLLCVGRLAPEKNIEMILRACAFIKDATDFHFVIVGIGEEEEKLKKLTSELGLQARVTFTGFVSNEDLPALYRMASCFVTAGDVELQSLATMEAMASGLPVIAVDKLALPELVHRGENGFLFQHRDSEELARAIKRMFENEGMRKKMGIKSLKIIQAHDIEKTLDAYEKMYESLR